MCKADQGTLCEHLDWIAAPRQLPAQRLRIGQAASQQKGSRRETEEAAGLASIASPRPSSNPSPDSKLHGDTGPLHGASI